MGKQRSFRTTITIPPDLKKRMEAVQERVNWSALACRAFEAKLAEIAERKAAKTMEDVIQRLRASKSRTDEENFKEGERAGQEWAKNRAEADELRRLDKWDWNRVIDSNESWAAVEFYLSMHPKGGIKGAYEFWESVLGKRYDVFTDDPVFLRGFAKGALDIWEEVEKQL